MAKPKQTETSKLTEWQKNYRPPKDGFGADFAKAMVATLRASGSKQKPNDPPRPR